MVEIGGYSIQHNQGDSTARTGIQHSEYECWGPACMKGKSGVTFDADLSLLFFEKNILYMKEEACWYIPLLLNDY